MNKVIFQTWKSKTHIPDPLRFWQSTWQEKHPDWQYVLWDDHDNREFIRCHYSWFLDVYDRYPREIFRADAIRYFFLYHFGGMYVDMDFECLKPMDALLNTLPESVILGRMGCDPHHPHSTPNALMVSKAAGHAFWRYVIFRLRTPAPGWGPEYCTGPVMLFDSLSSFGSSDIAVLPPQYFYPVDWSSPAGQDTRRRVVGQGHLLSEEEKRVRFPESYAVTYWTHKW